MKVRDKMMSNLKDGKKRNDVVSNQLRIHLQETHFWSSSWKIKGPINRLQQHSVTNRHGRGKPRPSPWNGLPSPNFFAHHISFIDIIKMSTEQRVRGIFIWQRSGQQPLSRFSKLKTINVQNLLVSMPGRTRTSGGRKENGLWIEKDNFREINGQERWCTC